MQIAKCKKDLRCDSCVNREPLASHVEGKPLNRLGGDNLQFAFFNFQFSISESSTRSAQTSNLQWLPPSKSSFDIVPPFNLIAFVGFPTEENDAAIAHRRKVD